MAVLISLGGNSSGQGFLLAPVGATYPAELSLATDTGTLSVTLQASPNAAGVVFSQANVNLSTVPTIVTVHATLQSGGPGDTILRVLDGANPVANFTVTAIKHPTVHFRGRFEVRFATDNAFYNRNPRYTNVIDSVVPPGWTWALEGEPDFVSAAGNVPEDLEMAVGRVVRLNNPVALRPHAAAVVSTVDKISGRTTTTTETFTAGDPLIGQPVNFGPNTYLAGNNPRNPMDRTPEEFFGAAVEPMALFELNFGGMFSGASKIGPFVAKATMVNQKTRTPDSRPIATGLVGAVAERLEFGLPSLQAFSETRIDLLVTDYTAAAPGPSSRNLARRIGHLLSSVSVAKRNAVQAANPGAFTVRAGTLTAGWDKEVYTGKVDDGLAFAPAGSAVVAYLSEFPSFNVEWRPFAFHSDELCGHHIGSLTHLNADGSYSGDPHTRTVNGVSYDFQAVGEFTLLRDGTRMEVQTRQSPVATANPHTDGYSGLKTCVSVNTAVAARFGKYRIALQPGREAKQLQFYVNGKAANLTIEGMDLGSHRVAGFNANGEMGLRAELEDGTVLIVTPAFWNAHNIWYMNVSVNNTGADEGIMGVVPKDSWLPRLRNGQSLGPKPASLQDRYTVLYKKFADSWRVTDQNSLFVYASGTSTKTFTDKDWPADKPPCKMKPQFQVKGVPVFQGMPVQRAEMVCNAIKLKDLRQNCVFDVATTGDRIFAEGYRVAQDLRLYGTTVQIAGHAAVARPDRNPIVDAPDQPDTPGSGVVVTAAVLPLTDGRPTPTGTVSFYVNGMPMNRPTELDEWARARITLHLKPGEYRIRAMYSGGGKYDHHSSSSANLIYKVSEEQKKLPKELKAKTKKPPTKNRR